MGLCIVRYDYYSPYEVPAVQVSFSMNTEKGGSFRVEARREARGNSVASRQISFVPGKDDYNVSFDITDWDIGRYVVSAHLLGEGREQLSSIHRVFIKKQNVPAQISPSFPKISVRSDGTILLDGEPFCPFFASAAISPLCKDCFNVEYGGLGAVSRPMKRLGVGLPGWTREKGEVFTILPEEEKMLARIRNTVVTALKPNPLLLYWFLSYEAQIPMYRGQENRIRLNNAEELRKISQFVKSIDPNHLTAIQIDHGDWAGYKDSADIIEVACWSSSYAESLIPQIIEDVNEVRNVLGQSKPFVFWIGASVPHARTAEEIRCASYLALMHGAAGLAFHMGHGGIAPSLTRHWSIYTGLSREIEDLFPILKAPQLTSKPKIIVQPAGIIDFCVRRYNNRIYLITANTSDCLVNARISIADDYVSLKSINLLFEPSLFPISFDFTH